MQPSRQQPGSKKHSDAQQPAPPASTRQKKKPRVAFGRRVGVAAFRKPQDADHDTTADSLDPKRAATDPDAVALRMLPSSTVAASSNTSVSRLEAIVQASRAIPVSPRHATAATPNPHGRNAEAAAAQPAVPPAQVQQAAPPGATQAGERLLLASLAMPAYVQSTPGLAMAQGGEVEGVQGRLEGAATEDAWQVPYNHAVYADEGFQRPAAGGSAVHTALHAAIDAASAATTADGIKPAAVSAAPGYHFPATSECLDVARMSNVGLQKQYDTLLTDLAAQQLQQQYHSQLPAMRRGRLLDEQASAESGTVIDHGTQVVSSSANASGGTSYIQFVQAGALRADASTSPMTEAYPASQEVVLPDDPFHQQLPQHLQDLNQLSEQLPKHLQGLNQLPQQLPQQLHEQSQPQHWKPEQASEPSQLHNASSMHTLPVSDAHPSNSAASTAVAQQPSMSWPHQASGQLTPIAELPYSDSDLAQSSPAASSALPGAVLQASAIEDPVDRATHGTHDSQGTPGDAKQRLDKKLLRASLAEWLADAVASKLWSAFEQQRQAAAPVGALGNTGSSCSAKLPGIAFFHAVPSMS